MDAYCKRIVENHRNIMNAIDKESPPVILLGNLISQERTPSGLKTIFFIVSTSCKIKLSELIENKVIIGDVKGTVIDNCNEQIEVLLNKKIPKGMYNIKRHSNYNNQVLLDAAISFIKSDKKIHKSLYIPINEEIPEYIDYETRFINKNLNNSQKRAVEYARINKPYKILGPPGTGKTETIIEIITQKLADN